MHRRAEFSFTAGSPARGLLPPRPPATHPTMAAPPRYGRDDDEEEARWLQASLQASPETNYSSGSGSGTASPQLWAQSPQAQNLHHRQYPASAGSSPSRAQAIAGYRREMLDLVRGLPEAAYELSLRDIVEHRHQPSSPPSPPSPPLPPPPPPAASTVGGRHLSRAAVPVPVPVGAQEKKDEPAAVAAATAAADTEDGGGSRSGNKKQGRKQRTMMRKQRSRSLERSVSLDTGLLIKLFLPLSIGGKKKKVSPKPDADGNKKTKTKKLGKKNKKEAAVAAAQHQQQQQDEEWWTKSEFSEAGGSSSRTSSTGSSNSSAASVRNGVNGGVNPIAPARSWSRKRTGCYAFFRANKGKNGANQD